MEFRTTMSKGKINKPTAQTQVMEITIKVIRVQSEGNPAPTDNIQVYRNGGAEYIGLNDLTTYEKEHLSDLVDMFDGTKWECKSGECGHEWKEFDPFVTPGDCPKCGYDYVEHY